MTVSDPQAPVDSSPTVDVDRLEGAEDYRLDPNARARRVAKRACRSRAAYAMGHGYDEVHYVLQDLAVILGATDGDGKLVFEAIQVSRVADACHWLAVHACDDVLADDAALVAYALREAVDVEPQVLPDGGHSRADTDCWHHKEYGEHCWRPLNNNLPYETAKRCDICGETKGKGAHIIPDGGRCLQPGTEGGDSA